MNTNDQYEILFILHSAFLDIRMAAYENKLGPAKVLSQLLHNIPLRLEMVYQGKQSCADILDDLNRNSVELGCDKWLNNALNLARQRRPPSKQQG